VGGENDLFGSRMKLWLNSEIDNRVRKQPGVKAKSKRDYRSSKRNTGKVAGEAFNTAAPLTVTVVL